MRYLKNLPQFKHSEHNRLQPLTEAFSNDITWGGSLLGRFINSTIRWVGIRYRATKIDALIEEFRSELDKTPMHYMSDEEVQYARGTRLYYILNQIYQVANAQATLAQRLLLLLSQNQIRMGGAGGPVNTSYDFRSLNRLQKINEYAQDKEEEVDEDMGLIEMALNDAKSSNTPNKASLIDKLEAFRDELMEIEVPEMSKSEIQKIDTSKLLGPAQEKSEAQAKDTDVTFSFYNDTRTFLESYLNLHNQIKQNVVKQSTLKKDSIVMWVGQKGENKGKLIFGKIIEEPKTDSDVINVQRLKKEGGQKDPKLINQPFILKKDKVKALTYFDENKFNKIREITEKELRNKLEQAKVGYYTFYQSKNSTKANEYSKKIQDIVKKLEELKNKNSVEKPNEETKAPTTASVEAQVKEMFSIQRYWEQYDIVNEAEVVIDDKKINKWSNIVSKFSKAKEESGDNYQKHLNYIGELLKGKVDGKEDGKLSKKWLRKLGKAIMLEIKEKYPRIWGSTQIPEIKNTAASDIDENKVKELAQIVVKFLTIFLLVKGNKEFLDSLRDENKEGIGKVIDKLFSSYDKMIETYKKASQQIKESNSSVLTSYDRFRLISEAEESSTQDEDEIPQDEIQSETEEKESGGDDPIVKAYYNYFEKGEEKKWKVNEEEIRNFKPSIETKVKKVVVGKKNEAISLITEADDVETPPNPEHDPIVRIVEIFGRAYKLYATMYIPSGRPGGRVSQRTLREYEYIGSGDDRTSAGGEGTDFYTPGKGPWAALHIFEKWRKGVTSIIEKREYRRILANIQYVGSAEADTGTQQIKTDPDRSSGITLLRFIDKMINLKGTFRDAASEIYRKYFNADIPTDKLPETQNTGGRNTTNACSDQDKRPYFLDVARLNRVTAGDLKVDGIYLIKGRLSGNGNATPTCQALANTPIDVYWIAWIYRTQTTAPNSRVIMRVQQSGTGPNATRESILSKMFTANNQMDLIRTTGDPNTPNISEQADLPVYLCVFDRSANLANMRRNGTINGHRMRLNDATHTNNETQLSTHVNTATNWQEYRLVIEDMFMLVSNCNGTTQQIEQPLKVRWNNATRATNDMNITPQIIAAIVT